MTSSSSEIPKTAPHGECIVPKANQLIMQAFLGCLMVQTFLSCPVEERPYAEMCEFINGFITSVLVNLPQLTVKTREHTMIVHPRHFTSLLVAHRQITHNVLSVCPGVPVPASCVFSLSDIEILHSELRISGGRQSRATLEGYKTGLRLTSPPIVHRMPPIHDWPSCLLMDSLPRSAHEEHHSVYHESEPVDIRRERRASRITLRLNDGGYVACYVNLIELGYRIVFEMNGDVLAAIVIIIDFGYDYCCHRVKFWHSTCGVFAGESWTDDQFGDAYYAVREVSSLAILKTIALQLRTDPGSRLSAGDGKISMLNSCDNEVWAITTMVNTRCKCDAYRGRLGLCLEGVVITRAGREQFAVPQAVERYRPNGHEILISDCYKSALQRHAEEYATLRWSLFRAVWIGAVVRSAGARVRAGAI